MALFGKKKEEVRETACCSSRTTAPQGSEDAGQPTEGVCCIKVLGAGCKSCQAQFENAKAAVKNLGLDIAVEYITDMEKVTAYGVMGMPAIVVNEKVVSAGRVLKAADVEKFLKKA